MRDQHQCGSRLAISFEEQIENQPSVRRVEVAGGLIGHHDRGLDNKGPRQGHALLLAARKLHGIVIHALTQTHRIEHEARLCQTVAFHVEFVRQQHILESGKRLNQLVGLEDKADLAPAHRCQLSLRQVVDGYAIEPDLALAGRVEAGEQTQQRALAASTRTHNGHKLPRRNLQRDSLQNVYTPRAILDPLLRALDLNQSALPSLAV